MPAHAKRTDRDERYRPRFLNAARRFGHISPSWGAGQQGDRPRGDGVRRVESALSGRLGRMSGRSDPIVHRLRLLPLRMRISYRRSAVPGEAPRSSDLTDDRRRAELPQLFYLARNGPQFQERRDLSACSRTSAADWRIHDGCDHGRAARAAGARTAQARCSGSRSKTPCDCGAMCESHGTGASFGGARRHAL